MKLNFFLFLAVNFFHNYLFASQRVELGLQAGVAFKFYESPSSVQNNFDFSTPSLNLKLANLDGFGPAQNMFWKLQLGTSQQIRNAESGTQIVGFKLAYVQINEVSTLNYFQAGLIANPFVVEARQRFSGFIMGSEFSSLAEKVSLFSESDNGVSWIWKQAPSVFKSGISIVNGEGYEKPETGASKDGAFWLRYGEDEKGIQIAMSVQAGRYTGLPNETGDRSRIFFSLGHRSDHLDIWISELDNRDAVDGISTLAFDRADLSTLAGKVSQGVSGEAQITYKNAADRLHLVYQVMDPDKTIVDNSIKSGFVAYEKILSPGQSFWLGRSETRYDRLHSPGIDNKANWAAGFLVSF